MADRDHGAITKDWHEEAPQSGGFRERQVRSLEQIATGKEA